MAVHQRHASVATCSCRHIACAAETFRACRARAFGLGEKQPNKQPHVHVCYQEVEDSVVQYARCAYEVSNCTICYAKSMHLMWLLSDLASGHT
jgi:hypothetical protein